MSEFPHPMTAAEARRQAGPLHLTATPEECTAIAARFGLIALDRLEADLLFTCDGDSIGITGSLLADVVQSCVATGEPLPALVATPITVRFVPNDRLEAEEADAEVELVGDELDIIGYAGGRFDLGDMVAETMALALEPFPRRPDADAWLAERGIKREEEVGAFGTLAGLRDRLSKGE
jgi:uncharacterized metal-binding protein YceD (DUF177 family)